jgi:hypothetical protein
MAAPRFSVDHSAGAADGVAIWPVYQAVFGDYAAFEAWRDVVWDKHRLRDGFRLARAYGGHALLGFAYGYTGRPGQWWTDNARIVLEPEVADHGSEITSRSSASECLKLPEVPASAEV